MLRCEGWCYGVEQAKRFQHRRHTVPDAKVYVTISYDCCFRKIASNCVSGFIEFQLFMLVSGSSNLSRPLPSTCLLPPVTLSKRAPCGRGYSKSLSKTATICHKLVVEAVRFRQVAAFPREVDEVRGADGGR